MSRRRKSSPELPAELPLVPTERPEAKEAYRVVQRAAAELTRRRAVVAEAERRLAEQRAAAGVRLLQRISAGEEGELDEPAAVAADIPEGYVSAAEGALHAAQMAYQDALRRATDAFRADMVPVLTAAVTDAAKAAAGLAEANGVIAGLCDYMRGAGAPPRVDARELSFRSAPSDAEEADALGEERRRLLLPTPARAGANGLVKVRFTRGYHAYGAGDVAGFTPETAREFIVHGFAETLDPSDARMLGVANAVRFDGPQKVRNGPLPYSHSGGVLDPFAVAMLSPTDAARGVNLGLLDIEG